MKLFPKLPDAVARFLATERSTMHVADVAQMSAVVHSAAVYAATGGTRISHAELAQLRDMLREVADRNGYPGPVAEGDRNAFDASAAAVLAQRVAISAAEASDPRIWSFLACVLAPDIVRWRFPGGDSGTTTERFTGNRVRNTMSRLWWRAHLLGTPESVPRSDYLERLGEDELVQIMERASIAGSGRLARQLADSFLQAVERYDQVTRSDLMRDSMKRIRRLAPIVSFDALPDEPLMSLIDDIFDTAGRTLAGSGAAP